MARCLPALLLGILITHLGCKPASTERLPIRQASFQPSANSPYRVETVEHYDAASNRLTLVQTTYFRAASGVEVVVERMEQALEDGVLLSSEQSLYDPATKELRSKTHQRYLAGRLKHEDRVTYQDQKADQWFLQMYYDSGRRERMQYGNYYHPYVSLQARDIELYRDDVRNTKHHSEVRDYFPNPEIGEQAHDEFNIEMCRQKREWELREDGSPYNFQFNQYGNRLLRLDGKLEHEHIRQINIDYAPDGTVKPNGYREKIY